ncbi:hypothetical protein RQP46_000006 [Phenoliferia psychrophenolica]
MVSFSLLPTELLAHILDLSAEGEGPEKRQRARFSFALIARAFHLATADTTEFHVAGDDQARALVSKIELEKEWAAQEERKARSGRTTRSTPLSIVRMSNIRRLSVEVDDKHSGKLLVSLLRATPSLVALDLDASFMTTDYQREAASAAHLEFALGGLADLQELKLSVCYLRASSFMRILTPLKRLQVLDLATRFSNQVQYEHALEQFTLPNLHTLRIRLIDAFDVALVGALTKGSSAQIRRLDLKGTDFELAPFNTIESIIPHLANLVHFTWSSAAATPIQYEASELDFVALLESMTSLQSISLSVWVIDQERDVNAANPFDKLPVDPKIFDALRSLPSLQNVNLIARMGTLDEELVITFVKSHLPLQTLSIHLETTSRWSREQQGRVEEAAEEAGVAFSYSDGEL